MPAKNGFQFAPSDLVLLQHIHELRFATIEQVAALSGRSYKQLADRLARLEQLAYVSAATRRPHKYLYAVGREGIQTLIREGYASSELATKRLRHTELKDLGIRHAIFIGDIHVKLLQLVGTQSLTISKWVEGPSLWDKVTASNGGEIPIRPDAYFTIAWPDGAKAHFFLEADRGTMAHARMRLKITGYAAWFHQQRHLKKHPEMKVFRVLTVTETRRRAEELAAEFRSMMPPAWAAAYPVIPFESLSLAALMPEVAEKAEASTREGSRVI